MYKSITNIFEKKKWMYTPKEGEQFFFMHMPKTGGTTFRKMLTNHFPDGSYYPVQKELISNQGKYYTQKQLVEEHPELLKKPLVMGHYNIDLVKHLQPGVKTIVFLRNPIERILSHISHIINNDPKYKAANPNDVVKDRIKQMGNLQTRLLRSKDSKNFNDIKENLKKIEFIGVQEDFADSIQFLNSSFGWNLDLIEKENVSSRLNREKLSEKSMSIICRNSIQDILMYDYACQLYYDKTNLNNN